MAATLTAALFTAITFAALSWGVAESAARGVDGNKLPALLTLGNFASLEWPYRVGGMSLSTHIVFYVAIVLIALFAAIVTLLASRSASPRSGASAFFGTWLGVVVGATLIGVALYFWHVGDIVGSAAGRNDYLVATVKGMAFGGLIVGWFPAIFSWSAFKVANRKGLAALAEAEAAAAGTKDAENPFDFTPGSISEQRPVEPGFTYPSGDEFDDVSAYDSQNAYSTTPEKNSAAARFSDPTDVTGVDNGDSSYSSEQRDAATYDQARSADMDTDSTSQLRQPGAA